MSRKGRRRRLPAAQDLDPARLLDDEEQLAGSPGAPVT